MSVVGCDTCGYGPSGEPFDAEADVVDLRCRSPYGECRVGAETPSAVGERAEAAAEVVVCVFGFGGELFSEFGEDVAGAGGELGDCGRVSCCEAGCDYGRPPFGFHFGALSLFVMISAGVWWIVPSDSIRGYLIGLFWFFAMVRMRAAVGLPDGTMCSCFHIHCAVVRHESKNFVVSVRHVGQPSNRT